MLKSRGTSFSYPTATGNLPKSKVCLKITANKLKFNPQQLEQQFYKTQGNLFQFQVAG